MNSIGNTLKSGIVFLGLFLAVHWVHGEASSAELEEHNAQEILSKKEKISDLYIQALDYLIISFRFMQENEHDLAQAMRQDATAILGIVNEMFESKEAACSFKAKKEGVIVKKYPQCSPGLIDRYFNDYEYSKIIDCLKLTKLMGLEDASAFSPEESSCIK